MDEEAEMESLSLQQIPTESHDSRPVTLEVEGVSKRFCRDLKRSLFYGMVDISREVLGQRPEVSALRKKEFWALKDINFKLEAGLALGIIGLNGSGKTTLMRILAGLIKPTSGHVTMRGRMAPLLALGAGFIPVLTGRENIYTNMSVLGLTQREIEERFEQVVDFAEIGYALDAPVQSFSSGMVARLGFACAIQTQPDVLLLDEVLAVGDLKFREKCLSQLIEMKKSGTSMILIHHSTDLIESLCDEAIYLANGEMLMKGSSKDIIARYEDDLQLEGKHRNHNYYIPSEIELMKSSAISIGSFRLFGPENSDGGLVTGGPASFTIDLTVHESVPQVAAEISIYRLVDVRKISRDLCGLPTLRLRSIRKNARMFNPEPGGYQIRLEIESLVLGAGEYIAHLSLRGQGRMEYVSAQSAKFSIECSRMLRQGNIFQDHVWHFGDEARSSAGDPRGEKLDV